MAAIRTDGCRSQDRGILPTTQTLFVPRELEQVRQYCSIAMPVETLQGHQLTDAERSRLSFLRIVEQVMVRLEINGRRGRELREYLAC